MMPDLNAIEEAALKEHLAYTNPQDDQYYKDNPFEYQRRVEEIKKETRINFAINNPNPPGLTKFEQLLWKLEVNNILLAALLDQPMPHYSGPSAVDIGRAVRDTNSGAAGW